MGASLTTPDAQRARWGPMGRALEDFHHGAVDARITVHTDLWHDESTPVAEFYRPEDQSLPDLEITALELCRGRVLDLGAGAGRHALELQRRGLAVTAIDVAREAVEVMRDRGVIDARCGDLGAVENELFDTIVLLMHGIGLVGTLDGLAAFFDLARRHLRVGGQIVFDSADLGLVIPEQFEEGLGEWRRGGPYPGEVEYRLTYRGLEGDPYPWLFIDPLTLSDRAVSAGFAFEIADWGARGAYLARLAI